MGRMNLLDWLLLNMISHNAQTQSKFGETVAWLVMEQHFAGDEQREQVIDALGLREQKWQPSRDLERGEGNRRKWGASHHLTLSPYANWSQDFRGSDDELNTFVMILTRWDDGQDIPASDFLAPHIEFLATPHAYTKVPCIVVRDGLVYPQRMALRELTRPPRDCPAPPGGAGPARKRVPVAEQREAYRRIVGDHPDWSAGEINREASRQWEDSDRAIPSVRTTERILRNDPLTVETREAGKFVWHQAWCRVPAERAVIDAETPARLCAICRADITGKSANALTCSPRCKQRAKRDRRK